MPPPFPLIVENAAGRYLLVPPAQWPGLSTHGWMAKVTKVLPKKQIISLKFHDATQDFSMEEALQMKTLS